MRVSYIFYFGLGLNPPKLARFFSMQLPIAAWVFRWTFSSSPSHLLHFRQLEAVQFLSGELSTPVWRTVHRLQAVQ